VTEAHPQKIARQPFTFGGVARFAHAPLSRLLAVALTFGLISGIAVSWLVARCIAPVLDEAVENLPRTGSIERGVLHWPENDNRLFAANPFVSISVSVNEVKSESAPVDFTVEFKTNRLSIQSLLGRYSFPYPARSELELNRTALFPVWGAWRAPILAGLIPGTAVALMLCWALFALPYALLPRIIGLVLSRDLPYASAWKLAVAAQLPGSLMMAFALALYSTGKIAVILVFVMFPAHFVPTLLYLLLSPCFVPKKEALEFQDNPFQSEKKKKASARNPFAD
jgi:hypothetical protein